MFERNVAGIPFSVAGGKKEIPRLRTQINFYLLILVGELFTIECWRFDFEQTFFLLFFPQGIRPIRTVGIPLRAESLSNDSRGGEKNWTLENIRNARIQITNNARFQQFFATFEFLTE